MHANAISVQGVHEVADVTERPMERGQNPISKMVFIGRDLNEVAIRNSFEACLVDGRMP